MPTSQNGYAANDRSLIETFTVPGTDVRIPLRKGDCGYVLAYVAARFHREVEPLNPTGAQWCWGFAARNIRGSSTTLSNHASGTAEDLNAPAHPRGVKGTYTAVKRRAVLAILDDLKDDVTGRHVVRWGEDYTAAPVDGMHFEINADPAAVKRVADRLRAIEAGRTVLRAGDTGADVAALQSVLNSSGLAQLVADGDYGPATVAAVKAAQVAIGVTPDGVWGPASTRALATYTARVEPTAPAVGPAQPEGDQMQLVKFAGVTGVPGGYWEIGGGVRVAVTRDALQDALVLNAGKAIPTVGAAWLFRLEDVTVYPVPVIPPTE